MIKNAHQLQSLQVTDNSGITSLELYDVMLQADGGYARAIKHEGDYWYSDSTKAGAEIYVWRNEQLNSVTLGEAGKEVKTFDTWCNINEKRYCNVMFNDNPVLTAIDFSYADLGDGSEIDLSNSDYTTTNAFQPIETLSFKNTTDNMISARNEGTQVVASGCRILKTFNSGSIKYRELRLNCFPNKGGTGEAISCS